jgi:putative ABC transport system permease protein
MRALDKKLIRDLWHIRGQAIAIAIVIACGVSTVVMSFGTLSSLQITQASYYERQSFANIFASLKRAPEPVLDHIQKIPGVKRAESRVVSIATLDVAGMNEPVLGRLISLPPISDGALNNIVLREGRRPEPDRKSEVILSETFADAHKIRPGGSFSAVINGHRQKLDVVGIGLSPEYIYAIGPGVLMPDDKRFGIIWLSRKGLAAAYDLEDSFNDVILTLFPSASAEEVITRLDRILKPYGGAGAIAREDQISHAFVKNEIQQLNTMGRIIPPIFLAVAAFLLNVVISRIIATEREQIGLFKSFGYTNAAIGWHYLKLVLMISVVGVLIGFGAGAWFGKAVTTLYDEQLFHFPVLYYHLDYQVFALAAAISLASAAGGAMIGIRKAVVLPPAVAMQPAPPTVYGGGLLAALGLTQMLSQPTLMILRHVGRWPMRTGMTMMGISMSVAILVTSLFFYDAVDHMIDTYFHNGQRQDATVVFSESTTPRSIEEIRAMPGVLYAEPWRAIAAKIHKGSKTERAGITGLETHTVLHRVLDKDLIPVSLPEYGLVLSTALAGKLGVVRGDTVSIEALQGRRYTREVPVTALVEDYIAMPAYMQMTALNRLMGEGDLRSGAYLQVDASRTDELYRQLKDTPGVAGVMLQTSALDTFRSTMAETLDIMTSFYIFFGGMIAFGIVYNSARISLSERGRELASLRVLGFTRGEVSYILLGELAILTLAALLPGCVFGLGLAHLMTASMQTDLFRIPMFIETSTYAKAVLTVLVASLLSGLIVRRRIDNFDLIAVLKTRE